MRTVREPSDVADLDQQPGRAGRPDAVQIHQRGSGGRHEGFEFSARLPGCRNQRATECASVASVLRPCPVVNTRARADSFGGTSTTCSP